MLSSKQRAYLNSISNGIDTIIMVGKSGIKKELIEQVSSALKKREIVKGKVLDTTEIDVKEIANKIAKDTSSEVVRVIGSKFILYKKNVKEPKIKLPI